MADYFHVSKDQYYLFEPLIPNVYRTLWQSDPGLFLVGAAEGEAAAGVLVCRDYDNTISILYMAVSEDYRGRGFAIGMVEYLCSAAIKAEHAVFCDFMAASPYDDPVYGVLNATGMFSLDRMPGGKYEGSINDLAVAISLTEGKSKTREYVPFTEAKASERNQFRLMLREIGCDYIEEDTGQYLYDLSYLAFSGEDHRPVAAVLVAATDEDGILEIPFVWSRDAGAKEFFMLINHIGKTLMKLAAHKKVPGALNLGPDDVMIRISAVNESSDALLKKLLPEFRPIEYYFRAIYDML